MWNWNDRNIVCKIWRQEHHTDRLSPKSCGKFKLQCDTEWYIEWYRFCIESGLVWFCGRRFHGQREISTKFLWHDLSCWCSVCFQARLSSSQSDWLYAKNRFSKPLLFCVANSQLERWHSRSMLKFCYIANCLVWSCYERSVWCERIYICD